jgi:hypothetical protein
LDATLKSTPCDVGKTIENGSATRASMLQPKPSWRSSVVNSV